MGEDGSIEIPQPLQVTLAGGGDSQLPVKELQKAGRWQADCARIIYANNDFSKARKSDENYAKDAIKKAQALWGALPDSWKEAITGE